MQDIHAHTYTHTHPPPHTHRDKKWYIIRIRLRESRYTQTN